MRPVRMSGPRSRRSRRHGCRRRRSNDMGAVVRIPRIGLTWPIQFGSLLDGSKIEAARRCSHIRERDNHRTKGATSSPADDGAVPRCVDGKYGRARVVVPAGPCITRSHSRESSWGTRVAAAGRWVGCGRSYAPRPASCCRGRSSGSSAPDRSIRPGGHGSGWRMRTRIQKRPRPAEADRSPAEGTASSCASEPRPRVG